MIITQRETKNCCNDFSFLLNLVFFCRNINIGKITAEKKHKWFVDDETGGLK